MAIAGIAMNNERHNAITLLNIFSLAVVGTWAIDGWGRGRWSIPKTPMDLPWFLWVLTALVSWTVAYFGHHSFFRPAMFSEGLRHFLFLGINAILPFYFAFRIARREPERETERERRCALDAVDPTRGIE